MLHEVERFIPVALLHHAFVLGRVVASRFRTGPHSPYEDGRCARPSPLRRLRPGERVPDIGFQRRMRRISPTQAPYSMAALRRAAGDGHLERSAPKAVSIRHVQ